MEQKKNYYEMLDIVPGASIQEIEEAYRMAKSMYSEDSVAVYSLYSAEERQEKLSELADVYETLSDPVKRKAYDDHIRASEARYEPSRTAAAEAGWDAASLSAGKDIFEEYREADAFKEKIRLKQTLAVTDSDEKMVIEKYRILYTRLEQISLKNSCKTFAVTSAVKGEGKTMTSVNLSYVMATEFRKKVLLLESDLRNPSISSNYLDMGRLYGLVDVIKGNVDLRAAISRLEDTNLYFLPARCSARDSSLLLNSPQMRNILNSVKADFDYVIVDSPPILPLVDMNILSRIVDGLMLVVRAEKTPKDIVTKAVNSLPKEKRITGIILNGAADVHMKKYYY